MNNDDMTLEGLLRLALVLHEHGEDLKQRLAHAKDRTTERMLKDRIFRNKVRKHRIQQLILRIDKMVKNDD